VYNYSGTNFSALTDTAWSGISGLDLAFAATFAEPGQPGIIGFTQSGANLVISGSDGLAGQTYYVLGTTNLTLPLKQWASVATNIPAGTGNFTVTLTNAVNPAVPQNFYILKVQ
ncbi:MAG TPA: hypothetical protein VK811_01995, partial [Candidatus Acidoferrum sp.]|nr:hypothetical protein [Candidatus Acidoferrum sp.]